MTWMQFRTRWWVSVGIALALGTTVTPTRAGDGPWSDVVHEWVDALYPDAPEGTPGALRMTEIAKWIDHVGEKIRNDGIVATKQPDIFSQSRLSRYRKDFEDQM